MDKDYNNKHTRMDGGKPITFTLHKEPQETKECWEPEK